MPPEPVILLESVTRRFGRATAVRDVTLSVDAGQLIGFVGPSGSGKTTTVRMLCGILAPTEGNVRVFGRDPMHFSPAERAQLGYLAQHFLLYPNLSVAANAGFVAGLYLRNIYEGTETPIAAKGTSYSAAFSPDGRKLAFCSTMAEEGNADIFVMDLETKKTKRLTFNAATETAPSWSPTGRELAFTTDRLGAGSPQIYLMDAEGSNVRKASFGGNYHDAPAWAPTSERIAFVSRVDNTFDIYVLNLRTNQITKLTENNVRNETPSWSPDGRHVVFASNISGSIQIYTVDYDGANLRKLTDRGENKLPNWTN